jgi:hypothetical protein
VRAKLAYTGVKKVQPLPLLIAVVLVTCAALILAIRFAVRAKKQAGAAGQYVLGLSAAADVSSVAISGGSEAAKIETPKKSRGKQPVPQVDERKVDETIHRFILSN